MSRKAIAKGQIMTLTPRARELFAQVNIHLKKTIGRRVYITQHTAIGTSFQFEGGTEKEFHIPSRMVKECFI